MVKLAAVGPVAGETTTLLGRIVPVEFSLAMVFDGATKLAFLRPGVMSFHTTPPSAVDSSRPSLEEAQPWATSRKLRLTTAALVATCGNSLAVSVTLRAGPNFRSVKGFSSRRFGARAVESTTATMGKFAPWSRSTELSERQVWPPSLVEKSTRTSTPSSDFPGPEYLTARKPCIASVNLGKEY